MGAGCEMSPTASLMKLHIQLQGGSCVDSCKAVVLGFATVVEGHAQTGILVLEGCGGSP